MKIVDAYWEKRNLGVSTTEFTIENNDTWEEIEKVLENCDSEYQVLRLPSQKTEMIFKVQDCGFRFVEDMVTMKSTLDEVIMNPIMKRMSDSLKYEPMNEDGFLMMKKEVESGLFDSDRIYIDPFFKNSNAFSRYANWIDDEIKRGSTFYKYIYKDKTVGFFSLKYLGGKRYDSFLSGFFKGYQKSGFGSVQKIQDEVRRLGGKSVTANVSSNNNRQIKSLVINGFMPDTINHIFIKHRK